MFDKCVEKKTKQQHLEEKMKTVEFYVTLKKILSI